MRRDAEQACLGVIEERFKSRDPPAGRALQVDVLGNDGGEDLTSFLRARDEDVQPTLTPLDAERAEPHSHVAVDIFAIAHRNINYITLIALDVLKIFDEKRLISVA